MKIFLLGMLLTVTISSAWPVDGYRVELLKDINPNTASSFPGRLAIFENNVYFRATEPTFGDELWCTDGTTSGTQLFLDINPNFSSGDHRSHFRHFITITGARTFSRSQP